VLDLGHNLGASLRVSAMYQDVRSGFAEAAGDQSADANGRSGDNCCFSVQLVQADLPPWPERPS
jgi:hypothetical protein